MSVLEAPDDTKPMSKPSEPVVDMVEDISPFPDAENMSTQKPTVKSDPQTPAQRIPLADLISNTEDALSKASGKTFTPDDQVYWDHRSSVSKEKGASPLSRRKKRCRSSSPTSSPLVADGKDGPLNSQSPRKMLKTPQHDVAADLWSKYIGKNNPNAEDGPPKIHFSQMASGSPRTPAPAARTGGESGGLRRTNSCAVDWPTSNSKRRRVDSEKQLNNKIRDSFARSKSSILESGKSRSSKIGMLVEKIQESLTRHSTEDDHGPSSSSPLPERPEHVGNRPVTPPKDIDAERSLETPSKSPAKANHGSPEGPGVNGVNSEEGLFCSSEFGDDDLDNDFLDLAVKSPDKPWLGAPQAADADALMTGIDGFGAQQRDAEPVPQTDHQEHQMQTRHLEQVVGNANAGDEVDEFDDGADEFPEGMEDILAQYDRPDGLPMEKANGGESAEPRAGGTAQNSADTLKQHTGNKISALDSGDDYGGDEFDDGEIDLQAIEETMMQSLGTEGYLTEGFMPKLPKPTQAIKRYLILDQAENYYVNAKGRTQLEKVLSVQQENTHLNRAITLRESWFESPCEKGSYIHLVGDFDNTGQCIVDDANNLIILHPDHLLSATVVADSFTCPRRAVIQDRVKATMEATKPQVYGHILHDIFQEAMKANRWDLVSLNALIDDLLPKYVGSLYDINVGMNEAREHLKSKMPSLSAWAENFVLVSPSADSLMDDKNGKKARMCINKLLEVEEHIWSPMYGLKGNVDATVQVSVHDEMETQALTVPLEVKTGRNDTIESHRAQTALYCLLLSDRYDIDVASGILYYLEVSKTMRIRAIQSEIRQMIQQRNRLAGYVRHRLDLPPMLQKPRICNQCYAKTACFAYHKLVDDGDEETSGMGKTFAETVGHLTPAHQTFFKKWDALLTLEEKDMFKFRRELWTMLSRERENVGRCFGGVVVEPGSGSEETDGPKINRFRYTFVKKNAAPGFSFSDSQITVGEPIVISDEEGHFALSNGYVVHISPKRVTVAVDRRLHNVRTRSSGFDAEKNQSFTGIMEIIEDDTGRPTTVKPSKSEDTTVYRLDKDEFSNGMATVRNNLLCVMDKNLFQAKRLRELIIDGTAPSFNSPSALTTKLPASAQEGLNVDQKQAIEKVMCAEDYALVLGMPGTGKTTTIAQIIRAIVAQGKSVLLTSYTHTAVDNILLKIRDDNVRTLRIGAPAKVHPDVQKFADLAGVPKKSIEELQDSYENSRVVATTCLGVNHSIFNHRTFDYCIVDEASQITLPVCLGPIRMAKTFILVGDHYQLPPLVQNKEASSGGLDISLFKLLCDSQPSSVVNLEHQYRMCEDIMHLSNTLIYSGRLKCGTPEVASRSLKIPDIHGLKQHHFSSLTSLPSGTSPCLDATPGRCWLRALLEPSTKACLVNTDRLQPQAIESAKGSRITNPIEATICTQLVESLISVGIPAREIGVVTLYRSQLALLRQKMRHRLPDLEMHTADRFQGRDKEVIIMSCVRSNPDHNVGDLLRDGRRVNVAFTRARTKMLIVGSKETLSQGNELLDQFVSLMDGKGWCYDLPATAVEAHAFEKSEPGFTQKSPDKARKTPASSPEKKKARSPGKTPSRTPLSSVINSQNASSGTRKPQKVGAKMDGHKVVAKRPVLGDVLNDMLG